MKLDHTVRVPAHVDEVWRFLDDIEAVAACMPGAQLTETVDERTHRGQVRLAVGPLSMNYAGELAIVERDDAARRMQLDASGRDRRGSGTAKATIGVQLAPDGSTTTMRVVSDVKLTGRIAALGRGVQDVSNKLLADFAEQLATQLGAPPAQAREGVETPGAAATPGASAASTTTPAPVAPAAPKASSARVAAAGGDTSSIKLAPLVWSVTRERLAELLLRISNKVRP
jgi:carbon monoxide dehydrogenase subunit G